ncbi:anti-sigma factor domain-containing protein [Nocardioides sp.]|uniref:anti-sigma factor n=1 Tax=Nocardioides sp. TaxID=35761 RepID=UPI0035288A87
MSDLHALSGAYAVDALDDVERARFERHLAECEDCRAEVQSLREAAALLADDTAAAPPPGLRDRVLADIATVRPLPPVVPHGASRLRRRWLPLLVAAAVLAVLGVGLAAWQPWTSSAPTLTAADRVLSAGDAQAVRLSFPDGSTATLTRSVSEGRAVITTTDMAPPPAGKVYELWLQHPDGHMAPAGLMPVRPDQTVLLDGDASAAVGAGITVEPAGGSPEPTSEPIALFDLQQA